MIAFLEFHLLQSTAFAVLVCLLALCLRKRSAAARHTIWLIAAAKFAVPAALMSAFGEYVGGLLPLREANVIISPSLLKLLPAETGGEPAAEAITGFWLPLSFVWLCG